MFGTVLVIEEWSSSLSLQAKMSVLCRFALRKVNGIICTDTLGCSIDDIDVVISYEIDRIG
ncbi:probable ATP-dependent RNA helicase Dbp73D [Culex pipiens pallens]|uniref:probable ATP-dependent RNA helicase Dbp73D n=1 Tax=Culex pipiens pallens TaxID=42434 RepID=UPI001952F38F|nr:probable ATP-dependent RNA helicase Dbp73D [Culex pipiens pallens]